MDILSEGPFTPSDASTQNAMCGSKMGGGGGGGGAGGPAPPEKSQSCMVRSGSPGKLQSYQARVNIGPLSSCQQNVI